MTQDEALATLEDAELVPCLQARLDEAKELLALCLGAGIPAVLDRGDCCDRAGCGCAPKIDLCVRPDDVPLVAAVVQDRWRGMLDREGTLALAPGPGEAEEAPCPACGTAGPTVAGACPGCGLQLEDA